MKLNKCTLRPGNVLQVLDGYRIKAQAPGLFTAEDDLEKLPPIMPWPSGVNTGAWSEPEPGQEVWILNMTDNPAGLFWFRKDRTSNSSAVPQAYEGVQNVEVLCDREIGPGQWATIYFSDGSGWIVRNGFAYIQIDPDGKITLDSGTPGNKIEVGPGGISLGGSNPFSEPAVLGDKLQDVLEDINSALVAIKNACMSSPYTMAISSALAPCLLFLKTKIANITSGTVSLNP